MIGNKSAAFKPVLLALAVTSSGGTYAAVEDQPPGPAAAAPGDLDVFELLVVGPNRLPVADARVEIRTEPKLEARHIRQGTFVRTGPYGTFAKTDAAGRLRVMRPRTSPFFNVDVTMPGYGPYWAGWSSGRDSEAIPATFTAELEAGWSVGGIVVDSAGKPVESVEIHPSIEFKKRPGDASQLGVGTQLKTDASGKWRFDSVPDSKHEVFVEINHPEFLPLRRPLTRAEFGLETKREPTVRIALDAGLAVVGKVIDEAGKPIAGALLRTKFLNSKREAKTGDDGTYRLVGCEPVMAKIVVSVKGRATDMKEVLIDRAMEPVDFELQPGGHVRIRVLDEHDKPIPKARIFFQGWRGRYSYFEFGHANQYADENGVWEWNEAPLDGFLADICRPDGMQLARQPLVAREEEYVFHPPSALIISGNVIDAETKQPVDKFRVVPGMLTGQVHWSRREQFAATDGKYRLQQIYDYPGHLVRIEAEGYRPAVSREIKSDEGNVTIDFALEKAEDITATVLTPELRPAAAAQAAIGVAGSQIHIKNGRIDDSSTFCARQDANRVGRFTFPAQETQFRLIIAHPAGYADLQVSDETKPSTIVLKPWARVEGTFRVGKEPVANAPITIDPASSFSQNLPRVDWQHKVTTGPDGRFVFERVVPGRARIGRRLVMSVDGGASEATSSCMIAREFAGGETTRIDLGGTGRAVAGRLQPPVGFKGKVSWNFAAIDVQSDVDDEHRDTAPYLYATVDREGNFRLDDVPAGKYVLVVRFHLAEMNQLFGHRSFSVPSIAEETANQEEPIDLGTLTLDTR